MLVDSIQVWECMGNYDWLCRLWFI